MTASSAIQNAPPALRDPAATAEVIQGFIRTRCEAIDADGVVINMSGGVDSTVTAVLAVNALGADRVLALLLPSVANDARNLADARRVVDDLGIAYRTIEIQEILDAVVRAGSSERRAMRRDPLEEARVEITVPTKHRTDYRTGVGNLAARLRMMLAYFEANTTNSLVLGTGNRTELLLGYFTKYGDGAADLLPIGDLYKTDVRSLASVIAVPDDIIEKPPTAGLWAGQSDEAELGATYETIDAILWHLIDREATPETTAERIDHPVENVAKFARMVEKSGHKRAVPPTPGADTDSTYLARG